MVVFSYIYSILVAKKPPNLHTLHDRISLDLAATATSLALDFFGIYIKRRADPLWVLK